RRHRGHAAQRGGRGRGQLDHLQADLAAGGAGTEERQEGEEETERQRAHRARSTRSRPPVQPRGAARGAALHNGARMFVAVLTAFASCSAQPPDAPVPITLGGAPFTELRHAELSRPVLWPVPDRAGRELTRARPLARAPE